MPTISSFYGIVIMMFLVEKEHNPPHIHAFYNEYDASFALENAKLIAGKFPKNGTKLVKEFVKHYKEELLEMWMTGQYKKLPPLN